MIYKFKKCRDCKKRKPISHFYRRRDAADRRSYCCKECDKKRSIAWQKRRKSHIDSWRLKWRRKSPRQSINVSLGGALGRCKTKNPVTLDQLMGIWEKQDGRCALSGIKMTWARGKILPTSITLDRIKPHLGYSKGNVRLICHAINSFRGRMADKTMLKMAKALVKNMEQR